MRFYYIYKLYVALLYVEEYLNLQETGKFNFRNGVITIEQREEDSFKIFFLSGHSLRVDSLYKVEDFIELQIMAIKRTFLLFNFGVWVQQRLEKMFFHLAINGYCVWDFCKFTYNTKTKFNNTIRRIISRK